MASEEKLQGVLGALKELEADTSLPKNVKAKLITIIKLLEAGSEVSMKVSRALHELEALADDATTPAETRMQLFSIQSMLEVL